MTALIEFSHVTKEFILRRPQHRSMRYALFDLAKRSLGLGNMPKEKFVALRDLTFRIARGESAAIIGENGSGKSTILKLITRIIEPNQGHVRVSGRVAALLELGAGFHHELTGRENIFL